ncbi:alpha/beta hydrolase family protein [Streptomyces sp. SKN60]|uniref:alpha/beta hydrolase n=1 Tax=Streptomyces sp. SKN60 TaxID=2855506 RepID=UPI0022458999|nr:alpha/beta hydrolase [Streptomyces sp. SKN60]MCX2181192.1 alpha/beta hydrolase family protein [Streptomyces sp. SKN60]
MAPPLARIRRGLLAALVTAAVALPVAGAAGPAEVPAPAPPPTAPLTAGTPAELTARLDARYADRRAALRAAEQTAHAYGARRRAAALHAMAEPGRRFLAFDGRDGGRSAEVVGDLARADRIAVLVPGVDTGLDHYARFRAGALALRDTLRRDTGGDRTRGDRTAVVAWLGYRTPATASAASLTPGRAEQAAPALTATVAELHRIRPTARITLLCHSYGSVVCARAAAGTPAAAIVLYGSPGTGHDDVAALHTRATVWAGRAAGDWVARVPHVRIPLPSPARSGSELGFGADPTDPAFGARRFAAGDGGHSDYLAPGSVPLRNLARIVEGREPADA